MSSQKKREEETQIIAHMIELYCRINKHQKEGLCRECGELLAYAEERIAKCPFIETKTFCSNCKIHCYRSEMREQIRQVMRFSGPRMLFTHPIMAVRHVILSKREKRKNKNAG